MIIFYSVMGEGLGHAIRSKIIIKHLSKKHHVEIFAAERAYPYLKDLNVHKIHSPHLEYKNNRILFFATILKNLQKFEKLKNSYNFICKEIQSKKPAIFICDFEPLGNYAAAFYKIPCISIDNQHFVHYGEYPLKLKHLFDMLLTFIIVKLIIIKAKYKIIFSLQPDKNRKNVFFFQPGLREIVRKIKPRKDNYFLIYQTTSTNNKLIEVLQKVNEKFIVYGYHKESKEKNIHFKKFHEKLFLKDLAGCKAAILGGGFNTISEALYYNKPVLCTPIKNQFEQIVNALILKKKGYGDYTLNISKDTINNFISNCPKYRKNISKIKQESHNKSLRKISHLVKSLN